MGLAGLWAVDQPGPIGSAFEAMNIYYTVYIQREREKKTEREKGRKKERDRETQRGRDAHT